MKPAMAVATPAKAEEISKVDVALLVSLAEGPAAAPERASAAGPSDAAASPDNAPAGPALELADASGDKDAVALAPAAGVDPAGAVSAATPTTTKKTRANKTI
uniref:Uncharacterized protein n=1 Tax=Nelumbo nucifera TaxID=4432 RepID=A0A822YWW5_NELNU|nr:TPA_asm: hypothetical protein HUJ06_006469 [Nelumbo nucifera]